VSHSLAQRGAAEALGTGLLVATVVGSGIMASRLTDDAGLALLANTLATAAGLVAYLTVLTPISGAHLNPVVTLIDALYRRITAMDAAIYGVAQVAGGVLGTVTAHAMFAEPLLERSERVRNGVGVWTSELVATFGLILVVLGSSRRTPERTPVLVGLYIAAAYWFTASTSFANPAVTFARALTATFAGIRPLDVPAFAAAQLVGGLLAAALWRVLDPPEAS
jgi:glycerol uptake facilitator-like aquaporin